MMKKYVITRRSQSHQARLRFVHGNKVSAYLISESLERGIYIGRIYVVARESERVRDVLDVMGAASGNEEQVPCRRPVRQGGAEFLST